MIEDNEEIKLHFGEFVENNNHYRRADFIFKSSGGEGESAAKFNVWVVALAQEDFRSKLALFNALHDLKAHIDLGLLRLSEDLDAS